jgi:hypothetical protein
MFADFAGARVHKPNQIRKESPVWPKFIGAHIEINGIENLEYSLIISD